MKPFRSLLLVFVFLPLSALSVGCGGSGRADGDTAADGDCTWDQWNPIQDGDCEGNPVDGDADLSGTCRMVSSDYNCFCYGRHPYSGYDSAVCHGSAGQPWKTTYTYDEDGNLVHIARRSGKGAHATAHRPAGVMDGIPLVVRDLAQDLCSTYTYDAWGRTLTTQYDDACDGPGFFDHCHVSSYDCQGNLLSQKKDASCDGSFDQCEILSHDHPGTPVSQGSDAGCESATEKKCHSYTYDERRNVLRYVYDSGCDCSSSGGSCITSSYDEHGNKLTKIVDDDCDGTSSSCQTWTYDDRGNLLTDTDDSGCDGIGGICKAWSYDERGNTLTEVYDQGCDGPSSGDRCWTWTYDDRGNILASIHDSGCDGPSAGDECLTWTYDDRGDLLTQAYDSRCAGTKYYIYWHHVYDDQERLLLKIGGNSTCSFTFYDQHGNVTFSMSSQNCSHYDEWGCTTTRYQCLDGDTWTDSATGGDGDTETEPDSDCSGPCVRPTVQEDCRDGWCHISAGCFTMPHEVRLTRDFEMMATEMSRGQFQSLVGYAPTDSPVCGGTDCPLRQVSWHEALKAANALSAAQGYPECFDCNTTPYPGLHCRLKAQYARPQECPGYRLPTEAEWQLASDGWGLQGINDTVTEWVWDWYGDYPQACVTDPVGPATGLYRVYRRCNERVCMTNKPGRDDFVPAFRYADLGFRLARTLPAGGDGDVENDGDGEAE